MIAKDVIKNKMINVAGQNFIENEKVLDESQQTKKPMKNTLGMIKLKLMFLTKFFRIMENNLKMIMFKKYVN